MDLNGDGQVDLLSGSYSRPGADMAGLFQVLWGAEDGFSTPQPLRGSDGLPLIIGSDSEDPGSLLRVGTRPSICDINSDGHLDLIAGNREGTFHVFWGEDEHRLSPVSETLRNDRGPLQVKHHSDPFPVDWDGDGDIDLISGSRHGGVFLALNSGSPTEPRFQRLETLVPTPRNAGLIRSELKLGVRHVMRPRSYTRVAVADVNSDGVHDLLVGDNGELRFPREGRTEEETQAAYAEWQSDLEALMEQDETAEGWSERFSAHQEALNDVVDTRWHGLVFVYLGQRYEDLRATAPEER